MDIGQKLKELRIQKNLTQEELAERCDLTKGFISQVENGNSSPSLETFLAILEVLGTSPKQFFDQQAQVQKVIYPVQEATYYNDEESGYHIHWLITSSNENEMEPILLTIQPQGNYKNFQPSTAESYGYVLSGQVTLLLGKQSYTIEAGDSFYYLANQEHQLVNASENPASLILVATESYM